MAKPLPLLTPTSDPSCCPPLAAAPLSVDESLEFSVRLKALADPARLRLMSLLLASEGQEVCTCELTEPLGLSQPTVTHHLQTLAKAGLIVGERRGVWTYYRPVTAALSEVSKVLDPRCC